MGSAYDICRCGCERRKHGDERHSENSDYGGGVAWTRWCECAGFEKAPQCEYVGWLGLRCTMPLCRWHDANSNHVLIIDPERRILMKEV